jgi:crossover junction endodeoxyribonuclease RusA
MIEVMSFEFPLPAKLLSMNDRMHWRPKAALTEVWRSATTHGALAEYQRRRRSTPVTRPLPPSIVRIALPVSTAARRDPHNYFATVKPIVDGLVDAGLWPDDTPEHVSVVEPTLVKFPKIERLRVRVVIEARA